MKRQFKKSEPVKAVAAGVRKKGILDSPRGQWHNWESEVFVFIQKLLIILSLISLYSNLMASGNDEINFTSFFKEKTNIDLQPNEASLNDINERFMLKNLGNYTFTENVNESQSGDSVSEHYSYSKNLKIKTDLESPLNVIKTQESKLVTKLFPNSLEAIASKLVYPFDESQKILKMRNPIINRKNGNI